MNYKTIRHLCRLTYFQCYVAGIDELKIILGRYTAIYYFFFLYY